ncbi:single-stranded DNA-binding protein [Candidatus Daviesbacteria bacterium]|nr:single-stranded DNA-binding protein [Candidatus Daviesbacteria bacterium]
MASRSWNRIELIGNLTRDPELRYTPSGSAVCTFGIATNRYYTTSDGEKKEETDFHRLVSWNKLAEICNQFLKKGMKVFISGRLQYREWEGQDGQKRRDAEITIEDMIILSPKGNGEPAPEDISAEPAKAESKPAEKKAEDTKAEAEEVAPEKAPQEEVKDDLPF